jgi:hypothetical protein
VPTVGTPTLLVVLAIGATVLVANLAATVPARRARRAPVASMLRVE